MLKTNSTYCTLRWGYPIVDFGRGSIRTCCRTFEERVDQKNLKKREVIYFLIQIIKLKID